MAEIPLRLGPLSPGALQVGRSDIRWRCNDGYVCRPGEIIAYCTVGLFSAERRPSFGAHFPGETRNLEIALAPRVAGRVRIPRETSLGGWYGLLNGTPWRADTVIGVLETSSDLPHDDADGELQMFMMAGRIYTALADGGTALQTGWHDRSRAAKVEGEGPIGTLLSLGVCELLGVIQGEGEDFQEILDGIPGPGQVVFIPDAPLAPSARAVLEQIRRTPEDRAEIARDLLRSFSALEVVPDPADWIMIGAVLRMLQFSPATERYEVLTRTGIVSTGPPDAILLSLHAEAPTVLRHKRLGYTLRYHGHTLQAAGPAYIAWLRANFRRVPCSIEESRADYNELIDQLRADAPATEILVCNMMSTSGNEDLQSYGAYDEPLSDTLSSVRAQEMNLMLHDLARDRNVAIIDTDAIAAELGGSLSLRDGIHQDGAMQAEVRAEILRTLDARGVPGFSRQARAGPKRLTQAALS